jgi:hypothetical protein
VRKFYIFKREISIWLKWKFYLVSVKGKLYMVRMGREVLSGNNGRNVPLFTIP